MDLTEWKMRDEKAEANWKVARDAKLDEGGDPPEPTTGRFTCLDCRRARPDYVKRFLIGPHFESV